MIFCRGNRHNQKRSGPSGETPDPRHNTKHNEDK